MKKDKKGSFPNIIHRLEEGGQAGLNDLTHDELLRAQSLGQACQYYINTIVKDGDLYREMVRDNRVLKPATYMAVIEVAFSFEQFIRGEFAKDVDAVDAILEKAAPIKEAKEEMQKEVERIAKILQRREEVRTRTPDWQERPSSAPVGEQK